MDSTNFQHKTIRDLFIKDEQVSKFFYYCNLQKGRMPATPKRKACPLFKSVPLTMHLTSYRLGKFCFRSTLVAQS